MKRIMDIPHPQKNPWGCGIYAVAHALNIPDFITKERIEESKGGTIIGHLNKYLQENDTGICIEALYYNHMGKKLPNLATEYIPEGEVDFLPVLINCRFSEEGKNHLVGGKIDKEGSLFLYDSLKPHVYKTTLAKVNHHYHHVYGLFVFMSVDTVDYVFM